MSDQDIVDGLIARLRLLLDLGGTGSESTSTVIVTANAASALSGHRAVTRLANGTIGYVSNDNPAHTNVPVWITAAAAESGAPVNAVAYGLVTEPSWSWSPGAVFLGPNGALTQTAPQAPSASFLSRIGTAFSATTIFVTQSPSITLT